MNREYKKPKPDFSSFGFFMLLINLLLLYKLV